MKPIKITTDNRAAIEAALQTVNGKATAFTVTDPNAVVILANEGEARLAVVNKANRAGTTLTYRPAGPSANAYKYGTISTRVMLRRGGDAWFLTDVERVEVFPKQAELNLLIISKAATEDVHRHAMRGMRTALTVEAVTEGADT